MSTGTVSPKVVDALRKLDADRRSAAERRFVRPVLGFLGKLRRRYLPELDENIVRLLWARRAWRKLANFLLVELQAENMGTRVTGKPYWLTIDPTNFCQLRCPFCPTGGERHIRSKAVLKLEDFKRLMDELGPTLLHVDFMNWGEPLLNRYIFEMVSYAKKFDIDTKMDTNLNEFSEEMAEKMVRSGLDCVSLSIDGLTQETYSKYRVRGDFDKVMRNLETLIRKKKELGSSRPYVIWQFLVFKHNEHEVERVRQLGKEMGVDVVGVTPAFLPFRPGIKDEWLPLKPEHRHYDPETFPDRPPWEWESAPKTEAPSLPDPAPVAPLPEEKLSAAAVPHVEVLPPRGGVRSIIERFFGRKRGGAGKEETPVINVQVYKEPEKRPRCNWPWAGIAVNPNGSVSPCCSVEEEIYDFGNIFTEGFSGIWNGPNYRRARRHIRDYVKHRQDVKTRSEHACERCFSIGRANFTFQPWWRFSQFDWWWGLREKDPR